MATGALNKGMATDARVGESIVLHAPGGVQVVLTIEQKTGQRTRVRVQSNAPLKIDPPRRATEFSGEAVAVVP